MAQSSSTQNLANHAKYVPAYHMVAFPILFVNLCWSAYRAYAQVDADHVIALLVAFALVIMFFYARLFALTVQDRVIRLEMRLRLRDLLPADLRGRIGEFTHHQLVALRFAGDDELPALARQVLDQRLTDRTAIKRLIRNWQADTLRA